MLRDHPENIKYWWLEAVRGHSDFDIRQGSGTQILPFFLRGGTQISPNTNYKKPHKIAQIRQYNRGDFNNHNRWDTQMLTNLGGGTQILPILGGGRFFWRKLKSLQPHL